MGQSKRMITKHPCSLLVRLESTELVLLIFSLVGDIVLVTAVIASVYGHAQNAKGFLGKLGGYLGVIGGT